MDNKSPSRGVVYAATGDQAYIDLAIRSAKSLKAQCPDLAIDLYTDRDVQAEVFDRIVTPEHSWFRTKIDALAQSRFDQTLYIDADTYVIGDIADIFCLFDKYDVCACHDPGRNSEHGSAILKQRFPQSFPTLNGGLIGIRRSEASQQFLQRWKEVIQSHQQTKDQPAFRELLWQSDLNLAILPPEYNVMFLRWLDVLGFKQGIPKVIHSPRLHQHKGTNTPAIDGLVELLGARRTFRLLKILYRGGVSLPPDWVVYGEGTNARQWKQRITRYFANRTFGD